MKVQLAFVDSKQEHVDQGSNSGRELISACAWCNRIRSDKDHWEYKPGLQKFLPSHWFTHGICPECLQVEHLQWAKRSFGRDEAAS